MTDREEFEKWWKEQGNLYNNFEKLLSGKAWQARGELDAVRIKELEAEVKKWQADSAAGWDRCEERRLENVELTAKLDKARDGDCCTEGCIKCDARKLLQP